MEYKFVDNSAEVLELLKKATKRGLKAIGATAEKYAKENCPVDTGRLRNSITYTTKQNEGTSFSYTDNNGNSYNDKRGTGAKEGEVYIGTNVEYASDVELGTSKQKAQPYIRPAVIDNRKEYEEILKESMKRA